ncbi:MAG: DMT family transporter [Pseudomonadota bacterium]|nr:DMT family transporter [Pseudomonadota bacterium]
MVQYDPAASAAGMLFGATIMSLPLAFVLADPLAGMTDLTALADIFGLGAVSTALAYLLYLRILNSAGATNLLLVTLLIPVKAGFLGGAFLGEVFTSDAFWGIGLIALGLIVVDGRLLWRKT